MESFSIMSILPYILGGIVLLVALGLLAIGITRRNERDPLAERLAEYGGTEEVQDNLEDIEMSVPFVQRVVMPIMEQIARITTSFTPQEALSKAEHQLILAGSPKGLSPALIWAMRFGASILLAAVMLLTFSLGGDTSATEIFLYGAGGAAVGFFLPHLWLRSKVTRRQDQIIRTLPDALDLMSICVEAGLGFDQAMVQVAEKWEANELAMGFNRVIREIQLGTSRKDALRHMAENMEVPDVTSFTGAIIQADQLGVSISKILLVQAETMRIKRRQRAQEKAQKAPIKMMIPMVLLIFPTLWLVLLGPAGIQVFKMFVLEQ